MTTDEKLKLITRNLEEVLTIEELRKLIESDTPLKHYIGFEISGKLHIGYLFTLMKVKDLQDAGAETIIFLADYHSAINDKLGGDLAVIKKVSTGYFTDAVNALFLSIGGDPKKLIFKLSSDEYTAHPDFWMTFLEMGRKTTLARTKRSITIMGREQSDENIDTAKLMYPMMQAADIFLLQVNIAHAGIDQRKVHVIARENALQIKRYPIKNVRGEQIKPVAIHHPILLSLTDSLTPMLGKLLNKEPDEIAMRSKMSKSKPRSGISIHDSPDEIKEKVGGAFAPEGVVENNPILNWTKYLVFYDTPRSDLQGQTLRVQPFVVKRDQKWGGDLEYTNYQNLERDYAEKKLHPQDLKNALAKWLIQKLEPVRKYFEDPVRKTSLEEVERLTTK